MRCPRCNKIIGSIMLHAHWHPACGDVLQEAFYWQRFRLDHAAATQIELAVRGYGKQWHSNRWGEKEMAAARNKSLKRLRHTNAAAAEERRRRETQ